MVCKCGHTKFRHEYQRDTQDKTGQCTLVEISNSGMKKHCSCKIYSSEPTQHFTADGRMK